MNRERCSELLDILLATRGSRRDAGDHFRVSLPFASGALCQQAVVQLHELLTGSSIKLRHTVFHRAKLELLYSGIGVLEFNREPLDSLWHRFNPEDWRSWLDKFHRCRLREVPKLDFEIDRGETVTCQPSDVAFLFPSHELGLVAIDDLIGVPSDDQPRVEAAVAKATETLKGLLSKRLAAQRQIDRDAAAALRSEVAAELKSKQEADERAHMEAVFGLATAAAAAKPAAVRQ
jgi:hypothetical protein